MENVENQVNFTEKKIKGFQAQKYDATVRPFKNLPINRNLFELADSLSASEFKCVMKLWNWFQSTEIKNSEFRFMLSRAHLAEVTGVSEKVAQSTLATLKRVRALVAVKTSFGVSEYVWSKSFLYGGVSLKDTAPVSKRYGRCIQWVRPLYLNDTASIICTLFIPSFIPSYTTFSSHSRNVDKSKKPHASLSEIREAIGMGIPKETLRDALRAGLPIQKVAGLASAILNTWLGADLGGSFFLHDIALILQTFQVNLYESENLTGVLYSVMKDGENLHRARKKIPNFYDSEDALFEFYLQMYEQYKEKGNE